MQYQIFLAVVESYKKIILDYKPNMMCYVATILQSQIIYSHEVEEIVPFHASMQE